MIHIRARNTHGAITDLCRSLSDADVIDTPDGKAGWRPRLCEPVAFTLHNPMERMVFDIEENPFQWFVGFQEFLPSVGPIDLAQLFSGDKFGPLVTLIELEGWQVCLRRDRGFLDMMAHSGALHLQNFGEHIFVLTMVHEYLSRKLEKPMGTFDFTVAQVSIEKDMEYVNRFANAPAYENPYHGACCLPGEMDASNLLAEVSVYPAMGIRNHYVRRVLSPMWQGYAALNGEGSAPAEAMRLSQLCVAGDVKRCARMYLEANYDVK